MHLEDGRIYQEVPLRLMAIVPGIIQRRPAPPAGTRIRCHGNSLRRYYDRIQQRPAMPGAAAIYMSDGRIVMVGIISRYHRVAVWQRIYYGPRTIGYALSIRTTRPKRCYQTQYKSDMGKAWIQKTVTVWLGTNVANVIYRLSTAVTSISTSRRGSMKPLTSIIDAAGLIAAKNSAWARPTASD